MFSGDTEVPGPCFCRITPSSHLSSFTFDGGMASLRAWHLSSVGLMPSADILSLKNVSSRLLNLHFSGFRVTPRCSCRSRTFMNASSCSASVFSNMRIIHINYNVTGWNETWSNELQFSLYEDAEYIGCYRDSLIPEDLKIFETLFDDFDANKCFQKCRDKGYLFAGTRSLDNSSYLCLCDDKYGTKRKTDDWYCECKCKGNPTTFCGCFDVTATTTYYYNRIYKLRNRTNSYELVVNYIGCFANFFQNELFFNKSWATPRLTSKKCFEDMNRNISANLNSSHFTCLDEINMELIVDDTYCGICYNNLNESCIKSDAISIYYIKKNSITIKCPYFVYLNQNFECDLKLELLNNSYNIEIDFEDGQFVNLNGRGNNIKIQKNYSTEGLFTLSLKMLDSNLTVNPQIFVKEQNISSNSNESFNEDYNLIEFPQYGKYVGCYYHFWYFNLYNELLSINSWDRKPWICMKKCKSSNYKYAFIGENFCFCSMKYGVLEKTYDNYCKCPCFGSLEYFCGCAYYYIVYRVGNLEKYEITQGIYMGCSDMAIATNSTYISFNTNGVCLRHCLERGFKYFSTHDGFYCNCENNLFLEYERISEEDCVLKCPANSSQKCGGYLERRSFYKITKKTLFLRVMPSQIGKVNETFTFRLEFDSNNLIYSMNINFGDGEKRNFTINQDKEIHKVYTQNGLFKVEVNSFDSEFNVQLDILISDETEERSFSLNSDVTIFNNGELIGCINHDSSLKLNEHKYFPYNQEVCSSQCKRNGFLFSAVRADTYHYCHCLNASLTPLETNNCLCRCSFSNDRLCGCFSNSLLYKIQTDEKSTMIKGVYKGCFLANFSNQIRQNFGFLTNEICIQFCESIKKDFASLIGTECFCGNSLNETNLVFNDECFYKCNGNQSQFCGGFNRFSVFEIINVQFFLLCSKSGEKYKKTNCSIYLNITSPSSSSSSPLTVSNFKSNNNATIQIDFGDQDLRNISIEPNLEVKIEKIYNETGTFRIKAILMNTPLNNKASVKIERVSIEIDSNNDYQGCFYDRYPYEMYPITYVSKLNMSNKFCQEFCGIFSTDYSATYNGDSCSCGNKFGGFNRPKNNIKCELTCTGNKSEICGGKNLLPFSIFISDTSKNLFYI
ncbi:unnamed protein product [Brachionus calyciflorus]|uniref:WSC domain-containing protein n=1 Tax=Brachionus calyciflorus TaxID=104777 RepID=A0A813ZKN8_9BILA|nr:unnamed protein product [Brachionus calyciflorus]